MCKFDLFFGINILITNKNPYMRQLLLQITVWEVKDGAYYCYCAYVLRIPRNSDFLSPMVTNIGIFLHGLKLSGESRC